VEPPSRSCYVKERYAGVERLVRERMREEALISRAHSEPFTSDTESKPVLRVPRRDLPRSITPDKSGSAGAVFSFAVSAERAAHLALGGLTVAALRVKRCNVRRAALCDGVGGGDVGGGVGGG